MDRQIGNTSTKDENGKNKKSYVYWSNMLKRCLNKKYQDIQPTYIGCSVCDEWITFENFERWFDKNYYSCNEETMCLDKDILVKGNKTYSPDTCVFVPKFINNIFTFNNVNRGNLPMGISINDDVYQVIFKQFGKSTYIGNFKDKDLAFQAYKLEKEKYIKLVADKYKDSIPTKLYDAMYKYKIEITD